MRRAAVSVPSNVAEGQARTVAAWLFGSFGIALGSLAELDTQLEARACDSICRPGARADDLLQTLDRTRSQMLYGLRRALWSAAIGLHEQVCYAALALCTYLACIGQRSMTAHPLPSILDLGICDPSSTAILIPSSPQ